MNDPDTAYRFDGKTGAVLLADGPTFTGGVPYSIESWVRPTSFVSGRVFVACQAAPNGDWAMFFQDDARPHLEREVTGATDGITGTILPGTGFAHIVGTFDGTRQRLYVDGVLVADGAGNVQNAGMFGVPFVIGANGIDARINNFEGDIDEVAIYDHALPDERIRLHHRIGSGLGP